MTPSEDNKPNETTPTEAAKPAGGGDGDGRSGAPRPTPAKAPAKTLNWRTILGGAAALIVLGLVAGAFLLPRFAAQVPGLAALLPGHGNATLIDDLETELGALDTTVAALSRRLEAQANRMATLGDENAAHTAALAELEARIDTLEGRGGQGGQGGARVTDGRDNGALAARVEMLTLRIGQLESAFVPLSERAQQASEAARAQRDMLAEQHRLLSATATLEERLTALEQSATGDRRGALIALSFAALRETANRGRPFAAEYETLSGLLDESNRPQLAARLRDIAPFAASGATTLAALRTNFAETSLAILKAANLPENASWWRRTAASLQGLVTIRPTGEVKGTDAEAIVARAERRLAANDLAAAVRELGALPPSAQSAAEPWLHAARNRLVLDDALAGFAATLIRAIAADRDVAPPPPAAPPASPPASPSAPSAPGEGA